MKLSALTLKHQHLLYVKRQIRSKTAISDAAKVYNSQDREFIMSNIPCLNMDFKHKQGSLGMTNGIFHIFRFI